MGTPADLGRDGRAPGRVFGTIVTSHRSPIGTGMTGSFPPGRSMLASGAGIGWWWLMLDFGAHFGKCWGSAALFFETCPFVCFYLLQADHHDKSFPADSLKWFHRSTALVACNPRHWANIQHSSFQPTHAWQPASHEATRLFVATHIKWIHGLHCALWSLGSLDSAATSQLLHSDVNLCGYPENVCVCDMNLIIVHSWCCILCHCNPFPLEHFTLQKRLCRANPLIVGPKAGAMAS